MMSLVQYDLIRRIKWRGFQRRALFHLETIMCMVSLTHALNKSFISEKALRTECLNMKRKAQSDKLKLKTISEIKAAGLEVEKIIINSNLTEEEAFAAEASLINAFNYISDAGLTNIVAGHHSAEALSVEEFERINGAIELEEKDIKHRILVIKIKTRNG